MRPHASASRSGNRAPARAGTSFAAGRSATAFSTARSRVDTGSTIPSIYAARYPESSSAWRTPEVGAGGLLNQPLPQALSEILFCPLFEKEAPLLDPPSQRVRH